MSRNIPKPILFLFVILALAAFACNLPNSQPAVAPPPPPQPTAVVAPMETPFTGESNLPTPTLPTNTPEVVHVKSPATSLEIGSLVYDVESSGTGPEKRAPYGDSYDIYRMERPFTQDMTYLPDMDIKTYNVKFTEDWIYVSIELIGGNPNNEIGIHYGVELDTNGDGFGEYIIWSNPPYKEEWSTDGVQVYEDENNDTGGLSAEKSDAPIDTNGYETKVFDSGVGDDPDLAWVRTNPSPQAKIQFAFKRSLARSSFLLGVLSDAGLRDVTKMFYNDRFTEEEAGSPEKSEKFYPLKALYAFDNACREAYNYDVTGYEPQLCPREEPTPGERGCNNPGQYTDQGSCEAAGCAWVQDPTVLVAVVYHCVSP